MAKKSILNLSSLKDQVYEYLRHQMRVGELKPGSVIDMNATSEKLGVSKTPLRDALIRLEMEGFVRILPRRGVVVNVLTVRDIREFYQILGALENISIIKAAPKMNKKVIEKMKRMNEVMINAIAKDNFDSYYEKNVRFHDIYMDLAGNATLKHLAHVLKRRLYDFPRRKGYIKEWEKASLEEHKEFLSLLERGDFEKAADFIRDVHWSFAVQEKYIRKYYSDNPEYEKKF
ncbi:MAG: GntR family transcriptional regulator [Candidatus Aminicenantaceae bacterium]